MVGTLLDLFLSCTKIGALAFGGGNAAIPLLEAEAVPHWLTHAEFAELVGINFAFPGVSILKLAGMVGYRAAGVPGMTVAIVSLALPGLILAVAAYGVLARHRNHPFIGRTLQTLQFAAVALLAGSAANLLRSVSSTAAQPTGLLVVAGLFVAVQFLRLAPALAVVLGAIAGVLFL